MIVNFMARGISQGKRKMTQTFTLIKKKKSKTSKLDLEVTI
jgi:hypothetical protein